MSKKGLKFLAASLVMLLALPVSGLANGPFDGGGGPILSGSLIDWNELQARFNGSLEITGDFDYNGQETFLQYGGGGFGGSDFRLGGFGIASEWTYPITGEESPFDRMTMKFDVQGAWIERFVSEFERGGLSLGAMIGMAKLQLLLEQDFTGSFDQFIAQPPLKFSMSRSYWYVQPFISTEVQVIDFMAIKITASYFQGISFGEWKLLDGQEVPNGPLKSLGFPSLQVMVLFGG